jgi:hypothetical protein
VCTGRWAGTRWLQRRLDVYRDWHNSVRTHQALGGRTPDDVWHAVVRPKPVRFTTRDDAPVVDVTLDRFRGDHLLPVFDITVRGRQVA